MTEDAHLSMSQLHQLWASLENEHHALAAAIEQADSGGADVALLRKRQARLLLDINIVVSEICQAPASTFEDWLALLDVALDHEIDLAAEIAFYGPAEFPMIARLLRALTAKAPGFEFNSLRRWLSGPRQFEQLFGEEVCCDPHGENPETLDEAPPAAPLLGSD